MEPVLNDRPDHILSFVRRNAEDKIFAVLNFSAQTQTVTSPLALPYGHYTDYFRQEAVKIGVTIALNLPLWGYQILVK